MIELLDVDSTTEEVEFWYTASVVALVKIPEDAPVPANVDVEEEDVVFRRVELDVLLWYTAEAVSDDALNPSDAAIPPVISGMSVVEVELCEAIEVVAFW
jgi:hypothetical protein